MIRYFKIFFFTAFLVLSSIAFGGSTIDELESKLKTSSEDARMQILLELSRANRNSSPYKSIDYAKQAAEIAQKLGDLSIQAAATTIIGDIYYHYNNDFVQALKYYQLSLTFYEKMGNKIEIANKYNDIGIVFRSLGNLEKAVDAYTSALQNYQDIGDKPSISRTLNNIGNAYLDQSNAEKGLEYYLKSLKVKEDIGDKKGMSATLNNIGVIYKMLKKFDLALEYNFKNLKIKEELNDKRGIAFALNNIGNIYQSLDNYDKAISYHNRALTIKQKLGDNAGIATSMNNIGNCLNSKGEYKQALGYYLQSLKEFEEVSDTSGISTSLLNIANIYIKLADYKQAQFYLDKSLRFASDNNKNDVIALSYYSYSILYSNMGDHKKSDYYYKLYISMNDSILNEESRKKMTEMQVKYDVQKKITENELLKKENEKKELQIAEQKRLRYFWVTISILILITSITLLRLYVIKKKTSVLLEEKNALLNDKNVLLHDKNEELEVANQKLRESEERLTELNHTKDKFFSIIAHDLRNPFSSLSITLDLLRIHNDKMNREQYENLIYGMKNTVEKANDLLENLLDWSRSKTNNLSYEPEDLSLTKMVGECVMLLNGVAITKNILFKIDLEHDITVFADRNMLSTILRNIVSNSIKFTHPGGYVDISYSRSDDNFAQITVKDNGVGISDENLQNLYRIDSNLKSRGTSNEKGTGLGLILCKEFIERHGCQIWTESEVGKGSTFHFTMPLTK